MTTKQDKKSKTKNNVRSTSLPPAIYQMEYPNCRTGMFSLRAPFKDSHINQRQQLPTFTRSLSPPNVVHPKYLHMDRAHQPERPFYSRSLQRDAQVQCSLNDVDSSDGLLIRRHPALITDSHYSGNSSPLYRVQLQLQPAQPNIYEVWNVETPPRRTFQPEERSIRVRSPQLVDIQSLSDESDYDDGILYARYPVRPYLPGPVRMVHVRQNANTMYY